MAGSGQIVLGVNSTETALAGAEALTSKMIMSYDPSTDSYEWSKIIMDVDGIIDVHYAANDQKVLLNWV